MKRFIILFAIFLFACSMPESNVKVNEQNISLEVDSTIKLPETINEVPITWESSNEVVALINNNELTGKSVGYCFAIANGEGVSKKYLVIVKQKTDIKITFSGNTQMFVNDQEIIKASINISDALVTWEALNDIVGIETDGNSVKVTAKEEGVAMIKASYASTQKVFYILVLKDKDALENKNVFIDEKVIIDLNNSSNFFEQLVILATSYSHQLYCYKYKQCIEVGSLVIYKREVVDNTYTYYAITNRHTIEGANSYNIKYAGKTIDVELVQYDLKVDLAVMRFTSDIYFPIAKLGDSDLIQTGEFIIAIGNQENHENTANVGIVSYPNRYVSDDTDGDDVNDWDAQYIQHDAPLSEGSSGGPLINMKGEVVGMNTMKLTSDSVENMGFAIPSNLIKELIEILETGVQPNRPILGVTIISISDILISDYQQSLINIPEGITYGMYINEVTAGGLADIAGMKPGDILLKVDGNELRYSYVLRAQLGKMIYGSGDSFDFTVYRDGKEIVLTVVF